MRFYEVEALIRDKSNQFENYMGPTSFYFGCDRENTECNIGPPHPDEFALSFTNRGDERINLRFFSEYTSSSQGGKVDIEVGPNAQIGIGNLLAYFQMLKEGFCLKPDHPVLYSQTEGYFCPWCNDS